MHDPAAATTSTGASFAQRNYAIAAGSAWSRLLEVQGFGQRYVDAGGTTLGTIAISANAISRYITFSVPTASLGGTPASGWGFSVVLTGQDGFSPDQARGFQATPQAYQFGVCASASADPHCTVDPATVPKAMDVITPLGREPVHGARLHPRPGGHPGRLDSVAHGPSADGAHRPPMASHFARGRGVRAEAGAAPRCRGSTLPRRRWRAPGRPTPAGEWAWGQATASSSVSASGSAAARAAPASSWSRSPSVSSEEPWAASASAA